MRGKKEGGIGCRPAGSLHRSNAHCLTFMNGCAAGISGPTSLCEGWGRSAGVGAWNPSGPQKMERGFGERGGVARMARMVGRGKRLGVRGAGGIAGPFAPPSSQSAASLPGMGSRETTRTPVRTGPHGRPGLATCHYYAPSRKVRMRGAPRRRDLEGWGGSPRDPCLLEPPSWGCRPQGEEGGVAAGEQQTNVELKVELECGGETV